MENLLRLLLIQIRLMESIDKQLRKALCIADQSQLEHQIVFCIWKCAVTISTSLLLTFYCLEIGF